MYYRYNPLHPKRRKAFIQRLESRKPDEESHYLEELINLFEAIDPTPNGKYVNWLIREYLDGRVTLPEDSYMLNQALKTFDRYKRRFSSPDIMAYTRATLAIEASNYDVEETTETKKESRLREKLEGRQVLLQTDEYRLVQLTTPMAAREAAKGTAWCVSNTAVGADYIATGLLLLVEKFDGSEWKSYVLSHLGYTRHQPDPEADVYQIATAQFMDIEDRQCLPPGSSTSRFRFSDTEVILPDFDLVVGLLTIGYDDFVKHRIRIFGSAFDRRYWEEYRADMEEDDYYFNTPGRFEDDTEYADRLIKYTAVILQSREPWIEEYILQQESYIIFRYVAEIIKDRWPEAEPILERSPYSGDYRRYIFERYMREDPEGAMDRIMAIHEELKQYD